MRLFEAPLWESDTCPDSWALWHSETSWATLCRKTEAAAANEAPVKPCCAGKKKKAAAKDSPPNVVEFGGCAAGPVPPRLLHAPGGVTEAVLLCAPLLEGTGVQVLVRGYIDCTPLILPGLVSSSFATAACRVAKGGVTVTGLCKGGAPGEFQACRWHVERDSQVRQGFLRRLRVASLTPEVDVGVWVPVSEAEGSASQMRSSCPC